MCEKHTETHADSQHVDPNVAAALEPANRADQSKTCEVFFFFSSLDQPMLFNTSYYITDGMA